MTGVRFPSGAMMGFRHLIQTGSGAHSASCPRGTSNFLPKSYRGRGVKLITHFRLVPRLRMRGAILPHPQYVFKAWCLVEHKTRLHNVILKHRDTTSPLPFTDGLSMSASSDRQLAACSYRKVEGEPPGSRRMSPRRHNSL